MSYLHKVRVRELGKKRSKVTKLRNLAALAKATLKESAYIRVAKEIDEELISLSADTLEEHRIKSLQWEE